MKINLKNKFTSTFVRYNKNERNVRNITIFDKKINVPEKFNQSIITLNIIISNCYRDLSFFKKSETHDNSDS